MLEKLKALYQKYHSVFWYLVTGGVTTLTNIAVFWALYDLAGAQLQGMTLAEARQKLMGAIDVYQASRAVKKLPAKV